MLPLFPLLPMLPLLPLLPSYLLPMLLRLPFMISTLNQTAKHPDYNYDLEEGGFTAIHKQHINAL